MKFLKRLPQCLTHENFEKKILAIIIVIIKDTSCHSKCNKIWKLVAVIYTLF